MDPGRLDDALDSLTKRDLERLQARIAARLISCVLCGAGEASFYVVAPKSHSGGRGRASMAFCPACFAKHRLPDARAAVDT